MNHNAEDIAASRKKMADSLQGLLQGAEELLRSSAAYSSEETKAARSRMQRQAQQAKAWVGGVESSAVDRYRTAADSTQTYVRGHPLKAIGLAVLAGVLLACLAQRR